MASCIFCNIVHHQSPAFIVYENDHVCCFLDKFPINKGHVLVVPKTHYTEFGEVDERSLSEVMWAAQKVARALEALLAPDGITIMQNNGIFKDVDHYHLHVFPRYANDGFRWVEPENEVSAEEFGELQKSLSAILE